MTRTNGTCGDCLHYFRGGVGEDRCRRYPPTITTDRYGHGESDWPSVEPGDWCGEWKSSETGRE